MKIGPAEGVHVVTDVVWHRERVSRCVGLPAAFATLAMLDGKVVVRGGVQRGSGMEARLSDGLSSTGLALGA